MFNRLIVNTLQNLLFCNPKAAVLKGKSVGFAAQKSRFRNAKTKLAFFLGSFFTKAKWFIGVGFKSPRNSRKTRNTI
ncbi:hypothetical protein [Prevotella intermedia]|uniref:Uncharacterized protein n=1 Tax=Prevotella intermedia TaxID=28131 RepID=A0A2G9IDM8_PREIN|nr:hypothetical protein [Prevotella intermedia]PIN27866.1 hypothetical protein CUC04_11215 [Prevotella intermedia]